MKAVLPQGTGAVEFGGVSLAVMIAIAIVIVVCGALWAWDAYQSLNRPRRKSEPCEEDKALDRLAQAIDDALGPVRPMPASRIGRANRQFDREFPRAR